MPRLLLVVDRILYNAEGQQIAEIGDAFWQKWILDTNSFRYCDSYQNLVKGSMTVTLITAGYWNSAKKGNPTLRQRYIGKHEKLTHSTLQECYRILTLSEEEYLAWRSRRL